MCIFNCVAIFFCSFEKRLFLYYYKQNKLKSKPKNGQRVPSAFNETFMNRMVSLYFKLTLFEKKEF